MGSVDGCGEGVKMTHEPVRCTHSLTSIHSFSKATIYIIDNEDDTRTSPPLFDFVLRTLLGY